MAALEELIRRIDRLEAREALHRLAYDYCIGADHRDLDRCRAVRTDGG